MMDLIRHLPAGFTTTDPLPWREPDGYRHAENRMPTWPTYWYPRVEFDVPLNRVSERSDA